MILPEQLKTRAIDGFYPEALKEIHDRARESGASQETLALLDGYPRERPFALFGTASILGPMTDWAERLQNAYAGSDEASQAYIREALEEVKNSLILQEKLKLTAEIRENLCGDDGKIYYEPEKEALFRDVMAKALWIAKFEQMSAENTEWVQQAKPGLPGIKAGTLAPGKEDLQTLTSGEQYGAFLQELADLSDVVQAQLQPNPGFEAWTVKCDPQIPYVSAMKKLLDDLGQGASATDSLSGRLTEFARQQEAKAAAIAQAEAEKAAFKQAKDNVFDQELPDVLERRNSLKGNYRITSEDLAKKLGENPAKAPKLTRTNSFTASAEVKKPGMQK